MTSTAPRRSRVGFVDIVGYTSRSRALSESELVAWLESFEADTTAIVLEHGGQVIKNIGDEVLFVADDAASATRAALALVARGNDEADEFPPVRAGVAYGPVVRRLGDVFGETVNIAARLTSAARAGTVLVDKGAHDVLAEGDDLRRSWSSGGCTGSRPRGTRGSRRTPCGPTVVEVHARTVVEELPQGASRNLVRSMASRGKRSGSGFRDGR